MQLFEWLVDQLYDCTAAAIVMKINQVYCRYFSQTVDVGKKEIVCHLGEGEICLTEVQVTNRFLVPPV